MTRSYPDWGRAAPVATVAPLADLGELAARLGSINTYDRRGNVAWLDDFEATLNKWGTGGDGTGNAVAISTSRARHGAQSVKLTTGSTGAKESEIFHPEAYPVLGKYGIEYSFVLGSSALYQDVILVHYNGANSYIYQIRYDKGANQLQIVDSSGTVVIDSSLTLSLNTSLWHHLKLVFDLVNNKYVRAMLNERSYDLSAYSVSASADPTSAHLLTTIRYFAAAAVNDDCYLDDVIITQNEPG